MFDPMVMSGWKRVWRETVRSFRRELYGINDTPAARLHAMHREMAEARRRLKRLTAERDSIGGAARKERDEAESARRRAALAREAGDDETARIAEDFAVRKTRHARILQKKADALDAECAWLAEELRDMRRAIQARADRE